MLNVEDFKEELRASFYCEVVEDESNEWLIEKLVKGDVL